MSNTPPTLGGRSAMRVLLYAPVDLNVIDGSAIWCVSVAQMLCVDPTIFVDILLERPLGRDINLHALRASGRIGLLDPHTGRRHDPANLVLTPEPGPRISPPQALDAITQAQTQRPYDLLIIRGTPIGHLVAQVPELAARTWFYLTQHGTDYETTAAIARSNGRVACQTPLLQTYLEGLLGPAPDRYVALPPLVPCLTSANPRTQLAAHRLCYVGKFDPHYYIDELIDAFSQVRAAIPQAELIIAGDKFYDPAGDSRAYRRRLLPKLARTPGVIWRGALPRAAVAELVADCDLGDCWRSPHYDDSLELSTKVLEYGAAGLPVLLNPARINRLLFGEDYPLFVDTPASFVAALSRAFTDPSAYRHAAELAHQAARHFTFEAVNAALQPHLEQYRPTRPAAHPRANLHRIVFAGHDLKFARDIIDHFAAHPDCCIRIDQWDGHERHDERRSIALLQWADAIWCEWCAGNAVWYSQRVRPAQRLIVRLHRYEMTTSTPDEVQWENVDRLIFIAPHVRDTVVARLGPRAARPACLVYNTVDCQRFARPKHDSAPWTLGLLGYCPKLKNPRLAAEILLRLRRHDQRWRLRLVGRPPQSYEWIWSNPDERRYYQELEAFIASANLTPHIIREDWTDDPPAWFARVGFILSCSDFEGSHQAVAEGLASGAVPVVRRWPGAADMYPNSLLFDTADQAAHLVNTVTTQDRWTALSDQARREARQRFDLPIVLPQIEQALLRPGVTTPTAELLPA